MTTQVLFAPFINLEFHYLIISELEEHRQRSYIYFANVENVHSYRFLTV